MAVDLTNDINLVTTPSEVVNFDKNTPTTSGVVFTPDTPLTQDVLYVSSTNASTWIYNGEAYVTYTVTPTATTPFYIQDTTIDAGGNKTAPIQHNGYIKAYGFYGSGAGINFLNANYLAAGTVPTARLGTGTANSTTYLRGDGSWATVSTGGIWGIANSSGIYTYYTTLTLAMASAVSGNTIEMFSDVTESGAVTITHKNGVIINGNGHTYTLTSDTTDSNFYNNDSNFSGEIINMKIVRSGRTAGTNTGFCLNYAPSGLTSILKNTGVYCINTFGTAVSGRSKFVGINGVGYLDGISNTSGQGVYDSYGESTTNGSGIDANAYNSTGVSVSGTGIGGGSQNSVGISTSGNGGGGTIRNSTLISTSGTAGNTGTFYNCTLISTSSYASSASNVYNCTLISSSGIAYNQSINSYTIQNCTIQSSTNRAMTINNATQVTNCRVLSSYNNVAGHAILCSSGTTSVITNNVLSVANVGASCIIGGAAITSKYASNVYIGSTTPINANVTQGITNTQDNQGNILL